MIRLDMPKARGIAHELRRAARSAAFAPLDVQATIPEFAATAEVARQGIRQRDAECQLAIDAAQSEADLRDALEVYKASL